MFLICNEEGCMPRNGQVEFAPPISKIYADAVQNGVINLSKQTTKEEFIEQIKQIQGSRYFSVNFQNIGSENKNTIEFRISNGTINPDKWIENISLFGGMIQVAQQLAEIQEKNKKELNHNEKKLLETFSIIQSGGVTDKQRLNAILTLVLDSEEKKNRFIEIFKVNSIEAKNNEVYQELKSRISPISIDSKMVKPYVIQTEQIGLTTINQPTTSKREAEVIENKERQKEQEKQTRPIS